MIFFLRDLVVKKCFNQPFFFFFFGHRNDFDCYSIHHLHIQLRRLTFYYEKGYFIFIKIIKRTIFKYYYYPHFLNLKND